MRVITSGVIKRSKNRLSHRQFWVDLISPALTRCRPVDPQIICFEKKNDNQKTAISGEQSSRLQKIARSSDNVHNKVSSAMAVVYRLKIAHLRTLLYATSPPSPPPLGSFWNDYWSLHDECSWPESGFQPPANNVLKFFYSVSTNRSHSLIH